MNKIFKSTLVALVALMGLATTSCVNEYDYDAATSEGSKVFFSKDLASTVDVSFDDNKFQVAVSRTSTEGELTVPLDVAISEGSIFTAAANSVTFADGEATAYLTFNYDPAKVEYGHYDDITVTIADESLATIYGVSAYAFKAGKTEWKLMDTTAGKAYYRDDIMAGLFGVANETWSVKVYESVAAPGRYMVEDPYGLDAYRYSSFWSTEDEIEEYYALTTGVTPNMIINAQDPNYVYVEEFELPYSSLFDFNMTITTYVQYNLDNGTSLETIKKNRPQWFGKVEDNVISMPASQMLFTKDGELWNYVNTNGLFAVALPGATIGDFSLEATFSGILTDAANKVFAVTEVELGDDATNVKAVVMPADVDAAAVADAIAAGDLEGIDIVAGANNVPIPEDMSGKLQVIFVVMNGTSIKTVTSVPFEYYGGANPWKSLGTGYFVDDAILPLFGYDPDAYPCEIEENTETPGLYRLKQMYANVAADFDVESGKGDVLVHAEDPNGVYIPMQPLELTLGSNGPFSISTDAGELVEEYGFALVKAQLPEIFGKLTDGVITFPTLQEESTTGAMIDYQLWLILNGSRYFAGKNGQFQIVLPNAAASVKAKMQRAVAASNFAHRLNGFHGVKASNKNMRRLLSTPIEVEILK